MFEMTINEKFDAEQAKITDERRKAREEFYADDAIWEHEFCGPECDGQPHDVPAGLEPVQVTLEPRDGTGFGASPCCGGPFRTHTSRCRNA